MLFFFLCTVSRIQTHTHTLTVKLVLCPGSRQLALPFFTPHSPPVQEKEDNHSDKTLAHRTQVHSGIQQSFTPAVVSLAFHISDTPPSSPRHTFYFFNFNSICSRSSSRPPPPLPYNFSNSQINLPFLILLLHLLQIKIALFLSLAALPIHFSPPCFPVCFLHLVSEPLRSTQDRVPLS